MPGGINRGDCRSDSLSDLIETRNSGLVWTLVSHSRDIFFFLQNETPNAYTLRVCLIPNNLVSAYRRNRGMRDEESRGTKNWTGNPLRSTRPYTADWKFQSSSYQWTLIGICKEIIVFGHLIATRCGLARSRVIHVYLTCRRESMRA